MDRVQLSTRAARDLRRMDRPDRARIGEALVQQLEPPDPPPNADIKPLAGHVPWLRLRVGNWRVLYRPCTPDEPGEVVVARVVHRRDLERAVGGL